MAGEKIGKAYEALLKVALDDMRSRRAFPGNVYWNETPAGISVEPDFILGASPEKPDVVFMVTHSGSAKESEKKGWRNIGELCEVKTAFNPPPSAINIVFDASMKEGMKDIQAACFDHMLVVGNRPYGATLLNWVKKHSERLSKDQEDKAAEIKRLVTGNKSLASAIKGLEADLFLAISTQHEDLRQLWDLERGRKRGTAPEARNTYVRRGLSKLLVFEDIDMAIRLYQGKRVPADQVPAFLLAIKLAKTGVGETVKPCDPEISAVVNMISSPKIKTICQSMEGNPVLKSMVAQIRQLQNVVKMGDYVHSEFSNLCNPTVLCARLLRLRQDPTALVESSFFPCGIPDTVWLFDTLMEIIKVSAGKANGYGYAQLAAEIAAPDGPAKSCSLSSRRFLLSPWGYLSEWSSRKNNKTIPDEVIKCVAIVLSSKIASIGRLEVKRLSQEFVGAFAHNMLDNKIGTYRMFEPLLELIKTGIEDITKVQIRSCFAEKADLGGRTGCTTVAQVKDCIINWQTATDSGKDHKRKELCGRAVGLRYTWDQKTESFRKRPGVNRLILLLDGTWTQKDLDTLVRAGWDEIYYPDEIDKLKASVLGGTIQQAAHEEEEDDLAAAAENSRPYGRKKVGKP